MSNFPQGTLPRLIQIDGVGLFSIGVPIKPE